MLTNFLDIFSVTGSWIVILFFLITLFISYKHGRGITTVTEYALASRKLSLPVISITFMATYIGANTFLGSVQSVFVEGLIRILFHLSSIPLFCFWGYVGYKYFDSRFDKHISMGDIFKQFLGFRVEKITSILFIIFIIIGFALQITVVGNIGSQFFGHNSNIITIITALIIII